MQRVTILGLLYLAVRLVHPLGIGAHGSEALLAFGFLILAAYTSGELAEGINLPRVLGYLVAGVLFGPSVLGVVSSDDTVRLAPVGSLAIALIAFLAGAELRWSEVRERGRAIAAIMSVELALTFVALTAGLFAMRSFVPFLAGEPVRAVLGFSILFGAIAIVHSPAVTIALLTETRARGPVARTTLGIVLVSDVVVILLFTGAVAIARVLAPPSGGELAGVSVGGVMLELGGAVVIGALLGGAVAAYLRLVRKQLVLFVLLVAFFGAEVAKLAHVDVLLTLLTAGFVTVNASETSNGDALRHAVERSGAPVFVVFFALAGAAISLADVREVWLLVIPLVLIRAGGIWLGCRLGARWAGVPSSVGKHVWMGLISQAGVAIGLAAVISDVYPVRGAQLRTLFLATLAVNQAIGPILFRLALAKSGELAQSDDEAVVAEATPT